MPDLSRTAAIDLALSALEQLRETALDDGSDPGSTWAEILIRDIGGWARVDEAIKTLRRVRAFEHPPTA